MWRGSGGLLDELVGFRAQLIRWPERLEVRHITTDDVRIRRVVGVVTHQGLRSVALVPAALRAARRQGRSARAPSFGHPRSLPRETERSAGSLCQIVGPYQERVESH